MRFLNSLSPSISVMYWNPVSISSVASFMLAAVLQVNSSPPLRYVDASMFMYIIVDSMRLCPSVVFTLIMSLYL